MSTPRPIDETPAPSIDLPSTPPPSFASTNNPSVRRYDIGALLSIAQTPASLAPPARLRTLPIRKDSLSHEWGVDELHASLFDESVSDSDSASTSSRSKPIPAAPSQASSEVLFNFTSSVGERGVPVLIDFGNPNPFNPDTHPHPKASSVFQSFPQSADAKTFTPRRDFIGREYNSWRSSSSSVSSTSGSSPVLRKASLNPFAPPFPLPHTTPSATPASLPLRKATPLPSSLPAKPGPLPPVFIRRESAALPQRMALPDVPVLGKDWEGELAISGNEKRRRASAMSLGLTPGQAVGPSASVGAQRPERLVKLGQRLRESISQQSRGQIRT